jgi:hypothetical protein
MPKQKKQTKVPDQDATYLRANFLTMSVPQMAKKLGRGAQTVYDFMELLDLEPRGRVIDRTHPFVRANRQLRSVLIDERQARTAQKKSKS